MNKVGFTGTRAGMTVDQVTTVGRILSRLYRGGVTEFHHGAEPHSDAQAARIAEGIGYTPIPHPGGDAKRNIARNHEIVDVSRVMIAAPFGGKELLRSGTWATIRYAKGELRDKPTGGFRPLFIVWPDGSYDTFGFETEPTI